MEIRNKKIPKHNIVFIVCGLLLIFMNISCGKQEIYYRFHELKNESWAQDDTLVFDVDSGLFEVNKPYNLTIETTNSVAYPYQNIWFFVRINIDNDSIFTNTSKEFRLADEFGKWTGSGFGSLYQSSFLLGLITFKEKRNYRIKLEHGMRDESLKGVDKVGVRITGAR
jgi:gliding motility-associated lipoprotein GldH